MRPDEITEEDYLKIDGMCDALDAAAGADLNLTLSAIFTFLNAIAMSDEDIGLTIYSAMNTVSRGVIDYHKANHEAAEAVKH